MYIYIHFMFCDYIFNSYKTVCSDVCFHAYITMLSGSLTYTLTCVFVSSGSLTCVYLISGFLIGAGIPGAAMLETVDLMRRAETRPKWCSCWSSADLIYQESVSQSVTGVSHNSHLRFYTRQLTKIYINYYIKLYI